MIGDVGPVEERVGMKLGWEFNLLVDFVVGYYRRGRTCCVETSVLRSCALSGEPVNVSSGSWLRIAIAQGGG
jgi:hypothetical protein